MGLYLKTFNRDLYKQAQRLAVTRKQTLTEFMELLVKTEIKQNHFFTNLKKAGSE